MMMGGERSLLCVENTFIFVHTPSLGAWRFFLEDQWLDQSVSNMRVTRLLDICGIKTQIPSLSQPECSSWVLICRGIEMFLNELHHHDHNHKSRVHRCYRRGMIQNVLNRSRRRLQVHRKISTKVFRNPAETKCYGKEIVLMNQREWTTIRAFKGYNRECISASISKLVMTIVRHRDQDERENDGAVHWNTMSPKLLTAFEDQGGREHSGRDWIHHIHRWCNNTRFEHCQNSKNIDIPWSDSGTHWWYYYYVWIDEVCFNSLRLEGIRLPQRFSVWLLVNYQNWTRGWREGK